MLRVFGTVSKQGRCFWSSYPYSLESDRSWLLDGSHASCISMKDRGDHVASASIEPRPGSLTTILSHSHMPRKPQPQRSSIYKSLCSFSELGCGCLSLLLICLSQAMQQHGGRGDTDSAGSRRVTRHSQKRMLLRVSVVVDRIHGPHDVLSDSLLGTCLRYREGVARCASE